MLLRTERTLTQLAMLANQSKLPRLPLPSLDDTIKRYLAAVKPIVTAEQFARTEKVVRLELAEGSTLRALHAQLAQKEASRTEPSFIAKAWDSMYLEGRWPVAINSNPGWVSFDFGFSADAKSQVQRAARLIAASAAFAEQVETGTLTPDVFKGKIPLDMRQYSQMFASSRVPRRGRDLLHKARAPAEVAHVLVLRRDHFWEVPFRHAASGRLLSIAALEAALEHVCRQSDARAAEGGRVSLAALTTADRDTWADARAALEKHSPANCAALASIDDALLCVCLDTCEVGGDLDASARVALCGESVLAPRWHDKSLSLSVSADGVPMGQFEHSWGDGVSVLRMGRDIYDAIIASDFAGGMAREGERAPPPRRLQWEVPPAVEAAKLAAASTYEQTCMDLRLSCLVFDAYGAAQLKQWRVSPDGAIQAALQLAFYRTRGHTPSTYELALSTARPAPSRRPTFRYNARFAPPLHEPMARAVLSTTVQRARYESASTAHFSAGRTETIRSATAESAAFVQAVVGRRPLAEQAALLRASAARHATIAREAAEGKGFDRHLYALRALATPGTSSALFADPSYVALYPNRLSQTTLTTAECPRAGWQVRHVVWQRALNVGPHPQVHAAVGLRAGARRGLRRGLPHPRGRAALWHHRIRAALRRRLPR